MQVMDSGEPGRTRRRHPEHGDVEAEARRSSCPVACALDVVGDRWTLLIVRDLLGGPRRYGELLTSEERIPTNILADRLRRLERYGLVERVPYREHPPRVEYRLTEAGRGLGPALDALARWGLARFPGTVRAILPDAG
jgi:DNA-binding HxlR family transcriptional regulator